jgi:hypothetical protein
VVNAVSESLAPKHELYALAGKHIRDAERLPNKRLSVIRLDTLKRPCAREALIPARPSTPTVFSRLWATARKSPDQGRPGLH